MAIIYTCRGKHFKAYNSYQNQVLEHSSDTEGVNLKFQLSAEHLIIIITEYVQKEMRIANQKNRIDLYILPDQFHPLLLSLREHLEGMHINQHERRPWRLGEPVPRSGRQGVPSLVKLAEINDISAIIPISPQLISIQGATAIVDSEIPSKQQTKWEREGGARQIHFGIFGGKWLHQVSKIKPGDVRVFIPINELQHNFIETIDEFWVED